MHKSLHSRNANAAFCESTTTHWRHKNMAVRRIFESLKADTKNPLHVLKPGIFRLQTSETVLLKQQLMVVGKTAF